MPNDPVFYGIAALVGLLVGVVVGITGIGGGPILVPAMVFILNVSQLLAQGISLIVIVPTAIAGSISHYRLGNVSGRVALAIVPAAAIGAIVGAQVAFRLDAFVVRRAFGILLVVLALKVLYDIRKARGQQ